MAAPRPPPWTHDNTSHSSLLAGFEIGLPPGHQAPGPILSVAEARASYTNKELPPIPSPTPIPSPLPSPTSTLPSLSTTPPAIPARNPRRFSWVSSTASSDRRASSPPRRPLSPPVTLNQQDPTASSFPSPPKLQRQPRLSLKPIAPTFGRTNKVAQLTGYDLASPSRRRRLRSSLDSVSSSDNHYSDPETYHAYSPIHEPSRGEIEVSRGSLADGYSKWGSSSSTRETISVRKATDEDGDSEEVFLPAGTYSNTSSALFDIHNKADAPPPHRRSRYQEERIHRDSSPAEIHPRPTRLTTSSKALTLDALIAQERARFESDSFKRTIWHEHPGSPGNLNRQNPDTISPSSTPPPRPEHNADFHIHALPLRQRDRPVSKFSEHSSSADSVATTGTTGFLSNVRDSVVNHVQNMSRNAPFGRAASPPGSGAGALRTSGESGTREASPAPSAKRKRGVTGLILGDGMAGESAVGSGPRSPFSIRSPLRKRAHVRPATAPGPATQQTRERGSRTSFAKRVGDVFMHVRTVSAGSVGVTGGKASSIRASSVVIADHNRSVEGPDTPRPWVGRGDGKAGGGGWMGEILAGGMLERARRRTGIRSREERRRDRLKGRIQVVGPADQNPDGEVNEWV